jgi:hypothetical protein
MEEKLSLFVSNQYEDSVMSKAHSRCIVTTVDSVLPFLSIDGEYDIIELEVYE